MTQVNVSAAKANDLISIPGLRWWKETSNFHKLGEVIRGSGGQTMIKLHCIYVKPVLHTNSKS